MMKSIQSVFAEEQFVQAIRTVLKEIIDKLYDKIEWKNKFYYKCIRIGNVESFADEMRVRIEFEFENQNKDKLKAYSDIVFSGYEVFSFKKKALGELFARELEITAKEIGFHMLEKYPTSYEEEMKKMHEKWVKNEKKKMENFSLNDDDSEFRIASLFSIQEEKKKIKMKRSEADWKFN